MWSQYQRIQIEFNSVDCVNEACASLLRNFYACPEVCVWIIQSSLGKLHVCEDMCELWPLTQHMGRLLASMIAIPWHTVYQLVLCVNYDLNIWGQKYFLKGGHRNGARRNGDHILCPASLWTMTSLHWRTTSLVLAMASRDHYPERSIFGVENALTPSYAVKWADWDEMLGFVDLPCPIAGTDSWSWDLWSLLIRTGYCQNSAINYRGFASSAMPWQLHGASGHIGGHLSIGLIQFAIRYGHHHHGFLLKNAKLYSPYALNSNFLRP